MKSVLRVTALAAAVLGVAACVQLVWQVRYSVGGNDYTSSETLAVGADGRVITVGVTHNEAAPGVSDGFFVATFDAAGNKVWEQLIPGETGEMARLASGSVLAVDQQNNVYVGWGNFTLGQVQIYKFDAQGMLVNNWLALSSELAWVDDLKVGPDRNLYVSASAGGVVMAYSPLGELLWQKVAAPASGGGMGGELEQYPGAVPASGLFGQGGTFDFFADGKILHVSRAGLIVFNADGSVHASLTATELGQTEVTKAVIAGGKVMALGVTGQQVELVQLDANLVEAGRTPVDEFEGAALLARSGNNVCVVTGPLYLENAAGNYRVNQFTSAGVQLAVSEIPIAPGSYWQIDDVVGNGAGCDVSEVFAADQFGKVSSRVTSYSLAGKPHNATEIPDYVIGDFTSVGKDLVQVGLAGEYDGSFTEMLLTKHRRY